VRAAAAAYLLSKIVAGIFLARAFLDVEPPLPPPAAARDPWDPIRGALRHRARTNGTEADLLSSMYREIHFGAFWVTPQALTEDGRRLVLRLSNADREGLERGLLEIGHLMQQAFPPGGVTSPTWIADLEWALSRMALRYTSDLLDGWPDSPPAAPLPRR
jgi:hypothetical protein